MRRRHRPLVHSLAALSFAACAPVVATPGAVGSGTAGTASNGGAAIARIIDPAGNQVGNAAIADTPSGLLIAGRVSGLGLGAHGVHIHEVGRCEPPFATAGPHYNPGRRQHGFKSANGPHAGDLPNIFTPAAGALAFEIHVAGVTLRSLLDRDGAALVFHSAADDYATDPDGGSGARIACGTIVRR